MRPFATDAGSFVRHAQAVEDSRSRGTVPRAHPLGPGPRRVPLWSELVVSASQAGRAERVVFLHDLLQFVSRAADHLLLIVVVLERATCGAVQDSLIKLTELRRMAGGISPGCRGRRQAGR